MNTLYGFNVQISSAYPCMQCSPAFARIQSPELVAETNAWMADFFGYTETVADGDIIKLGEHTLIMNQATYNRVIAVCKKESP